jgi:hypothetical protein
MQTMRKAVRDKFGIGKAGHKRRKAASVPVWFTDEAPGIGSGQRLVAVVREYTKGKTRFVDLVDVPTGTHNAKVTKAIFERAAGVDRKLNDA